jgi:acyl-CoA reductase-like NAD-dependent aldehyde dehydrogenase
VRIPELDFYLPQIDYYCTTPDQSLEQSIELPAMMGSLSLSRTPSFYSNKHYINGEYVQSKCQETYTVRNPKDESVLSDQMAVAGEDDVEAAVVAAEAAFNGPWSLLTSQQRTKCLNKLCSILEDKLEGILTLDSLSSGNPVSIISTREKNLIIGTVQYYAGWTDKQKGDYYPADDGFVKVVRHEPLGVCAAVNPYNAPIATFIFKAAPALATGNVLILKPSEKTPFGSLALAPLFEEAGIPKGVVQVLSGSGKSGALLASHMRIRKISFTGSVPTGKKIQIAAAQSNLKRVTLELGGKSPACVFEDANLENALTWTVNAILARSGQVCVAATRVYVQRSVAKKFIYSYVEKLKEATNRLGDPQDQSTGLGPLVDNLALERVLGMIERAKQDAELVVGGSRKGDKGCFVEPTVFLDPKAGSEILEQEVFGPVSIVKTFDTEEEVIQAANDTEFGLMAGVFTRDISRALRVSAKLDAGVVGVNCVSYVSFLLVHARDSTLTRSH